MRVSDNMINKMAAKSDLSIFMNGIFAHKVNYLSGRVSENESAVEKSISSRYNARGDIFSQETSRFDYLG